MLPLNVSEVDRLAASQDVDAALELLTRLIDGHPETRASPNKAGGGGAGSPTVSLHDLLLKRSQLLLDRKHDVDEARAAADRALKLNPSSVAALLLRARALHAQGKHGQAISSLQKALVIEPAHGGASELLALVRAEKDAKSSSAEGAFATPPSSTTGAGAANNAPGFDDDASSVATASAAASTAKKSTTGGVGGRAGAAKRPSERIGAWLASSVEAGKRKEYGAAVECLSNVFDHFIHLTREGRCQVLVRRAIAYYRLKKPGKARQDARRAHDLNVVAQAPWPLVSQLLSLLKEDQPQLQQNQSAGAAPPSVDSVVSAALSGEHAVGGFAADAASAAGTAAASGESPAQLDALMEHQLVTPIVGLASLLRTTPAVAMVDVIWSETDDDEGCTFDFRGAGNSRP
jgi:tetratricopeptide (TPR) repeat protein